VSRTLAALALAAAGCASTPIVVREFDDRSGVEGGGGIAAEELQAALGRAVRPAGWIVVGTVESAGEGPGGWTASLSVRMMRTDTTEVVLIRDAKGAGRDVRGAIRDAASKLVDPLKAAAR